MTEDPVPARPQSAPSLASERGPGEGNGGAIAWYAAVAVIAIATLLRVLVGARLPLVPDETYYWEWSRHLSFGYFDHPPMLAWSIRIGTAIFGDHPIGVRVLPIVCGAAAALWNECPIARRARFVPTRSQARPVPPRCLRSLPSP